MNISQLALWLKTKARKWYKRVLYHFTDLALVNAFILHKQTTSMPLYEFKQEVALALMYGDAFSDPTTIGQVILRQAALSYNANGDPVAADVIDAVRLDGVNHLPENVAERARLCKVSGCKGRSTIWCTKCKVYLCVKKGQSCFFRFHNQI